MHEKRSTLEKQASLQHSEELEGVERVPAAFAGHAVVELPRVNLLTERKSPKASLFFHRNVKTLLLSSLLAIVIVAMSLFLKDPTALFGERAADAPSPSETSAITVNRSIPSESTALPREANPGIEVVEEALNIPDFAESEEVAFPIEPLVIASVILSASPEDSVILEDNIRRRPAAGRSTGGGRLPNRAAPAPKSSPNTVRAYGPDGKPLLVQSGGQK